MFAKNALPQWSVFLIIFKFSISERMTCTAKPKRIIFNFLSVEKDIILAFIIPELH